VSSDDNGKCLVVVANKSDLLNESQKKRAQRSYGREFAFVSYAPVVFASALRGEGLENALELAILAVEEAKKKINQKKLREAVWKAVERVKPAAYGGKWIRITGCKQRNVLPPRFVVSSNEPKGVAKNYLRYLEKRIRAEFGFAGTPIKLSVVRGKR
jgi:GTP-binding protein